MKDEEMREKTIRDAANGELAITPSTVPYVAADDNMDGEVAKVQGKRKMPPFGEDITDLLELHRNLPTEPEGIRQACETLRAEIMHHRKRRKETFDGLVNFQAEAGTSGRMSEYRRLIGAGCGGVPPSEVDHVLGMLLEVCTIYFSTLLSLITVVFQTLESEEPSSSSTAWSGTRPAATG